MNKKLVFIGLFFVVSAIALRAASYIMQFAPVEPSGFGITFPLDAGIATFGGILFLLGLDPALLQGRIANLFQIGRMLKRSRGGRP